MEWIERVYVWVVAERNSIQTKMDQCSNATSAYNIKKSECQGADGDGGFKKAHDDMKFHCDKNQSALESQTCNYAEKVQDTCDSYNVCYNATNTTLSSQLGGIQAAESSRQSEWWIVQRIRCYFQVFVEAVDAVDSAKIEACKNADHNTSHLILIYPNVASVPPECESVLTPCSTGYISSEYGLLPSKAPAKECTACSVIPGTLAPSATGWTLLARQTMPYLFAVDEWSKNPTDPSNDNYAILDRLEEFRENGAFEFKLVWPADGLQEQHWRQTSNPVTTQGGVTGYESISTPYTDQFWGGLEHGASNTALIEGSVDHGHWFFAVGTHSLWHSGIPPNYEGNGNSASMVELYAVGSTPAPTVGGWQTDKEQFSVGGWADEEHPKQQARGQVPQGYPTH